MSDGLSPKTSGRPRGRAFERSQSDNPAHRRVGCRSKATSAAVALLEDEAEALTRKAVELALSDDPTVMRLCLCAGDRNEGFRTAAATGRGKPSPAGRGAHQTGRLATTFKRILAADLL
jgi:hypothetical protein